MTILDYSICLNSVKLFLVVNVLKVVDMCHLWLKDNMYQVFVSDPILVGLKFCSIIRRVLFSPNKMEMAIKKQRRKNKKTTLILF